MNWGNKLLVTFIVFGLGMFYLVYRSTQTNYDMVEKDYYKSELQYQQVIDARERTHQLGSELQLEQTKEGVQIQLPDEMKNKKLSGDIWFYCDYDSGKDSKITLQTDEQARQVIPLTSVSPGNYIVKVSWTENGIAYYAEKTLTVI